MVRGAELSAKSAARVAFAEPAPSESDGHPMAAAGEERREGRRLVVSRSAGVMPTARRADQSGHSCRADPKPSSSSAAATPIADGSSPSHHHAAAVAGSSRPVASSPRGALHEPHQPEVRLIMDSDNYMAPAEVHRALLNPAGLGGGALAVIAVSPSESRVAFRTWADAYALLTYCTSEVQRKLRVRTRPAVIEGVQLTRTQMARLAQSEGPPPSHILRAGNA